MGSHDPRMGWRDPVPPRAGRFARHVGTGGAVALALLWAGGCGDAPVPPAGARSAPPHGAAEARELVRSVYLPYPAATVGVTPLLGGCLLDPPESCAGPPDRYLSPHLVPVLVARGGGGRAGGVDPVICAQNVPAAVEVGAAVVEGSTARVTVVTVWRSGAPGRVGIRVRVDLDALRISGIDCPAS